MNVFSQWLGSTARFKKISASVESARKHLESKYGVRKFALNAIISAPPALCSKPPTASIAASPPAVRLKCSALMK